MSQRFFSFLLLSCFAIIPSHAIALGSDPIGVSITGDAEGEIAAVSVTGDAHGGIVGASVTGGGYGSFAGFSVVDRTCIDMWCTCIFTSNCSLLPDGSLPLAQSSPNCGSAGTLEVSVGETEFFCQGSCERAIFIIALAILSSADACEGGSCDRSVLVLSGSVGGDNDSCATTTDALAYLQLP